MECSRACWNEVDRGKQCKPGWQSLPGQQLTGLNGAHRVEDAPERQGCAPIPEHMLPIGQQLGLPLRTPQRCPANTTITMIITTINIIVTTITMQRFPARDGLPMCISYLCKHELSLQGCDSFAANSSSSIRVHRGCRATLTICLMGVFELMMGSASKVCTAQKHTVIICLWQVWLWTGQAGQGRAGQGRAGPVWTAQGGAATTEAGRSRTTRDCSIGSSATEPANGLLANSVFDTS